MSVYFQFVSQKSIHNYAKRIYFAARDVVAPVFLVAVAFFVFLNVITCTKAKIIYRSRRRDEPRRLQMMMKLFLTKYQTAEQPSLVMKSV